MPPYSRRAVDPPEPEHVPAPFAMMAGELDDKEFGSSGVLLTPQPPTALPRVEPPRFPAPDWDEERREREALERAARSEPALNEEQPAQHPPPVRESA